MMLNNSSGEFNLYVEIIEICLTICKKNNMKKQYITVFFENVLQFFPLIKICIMFFSVA